VSQPKSSLRSTRRKRPPLRDLSTHPEPYVTIGELAAYWLVSRKQLYKQIDAGTLPAIRLGPRLFRIRTADARKFERSANMQPPPQRKRVSSGRGSSD
jgi:excisionase family DNA binding protein